jgi:hypothetical protein
MYVKPNWSLRFYLNRLLANEVKDLFKVPAGMRLFIPNLVTYLSLGAAYTITLQVNHVGVTYELVRNTFSATIFTLATEHNVLLLENETLQCIIGASDQTANLAILGSGYLFSEMDS